MANAARAKKARSRSAGATVTRHALNVLRKAGIKYRQSGGGIGRVTRTTVLGRGRAPRQVFPKAKYKTLRRITY